MVYWGVYRDSYILQILGQWIARHIFGLKHIICAYLGLVELEKRKPETLTSYTREP